MNHSLLVLAMLPAPLLSQTADPSRVAARSEQEEGRFVERLRLLADLDGDGERDMLLSGSPGNFGNAGGPWTVYLRRGGEFKAAGELFAHPKAIAIEPDQDRFRREIGDKRYARVWAYLRGGAGAGQIGFFRIGEEKVDEYSHIEIHLGNEDKGIGKSIYDGVFGAPSPIAFTLEASTTSTDGKVSWAVVEG